MIIHRQKLTETTANNVRKRDSSVVRNLPLHDARGRRFDPRLRQKFRCPNTISLVSFAGITLDKCIVFWIWMFPVQGKSTVI